MKLYAFFSLLTLIAYMNTASACHMHMPQAHYTPSAARIVDDANYSARARSVSPQPEEAHLQQLKLSKHRSQSGPAMLQHGQSYTTAVSTKEMARSSQEIAQAYQEACQELENTLLHPETNPLLAHHARYACSTLRRQERHTPQTPGIPTSVELAPAPEVQTPAQAYQKACQDLSHQTEISFYRTQATLALAEHVRYFRLAQETQKRFLAALEPSELTAHNTHLPTLFQQYTFLINTAHTWKQYWKKCLRIAPNQPTETAGAGATAGQAGSQRSA